MVDAALAVGRSGDPIADGIDRLRSLIHATTIPVAVHAYDDDALEAISADVAAEVSHPPREAAVIRDGTAFTVRESAEGRGLAAADVAAALATAVDNADPGDVRVELTATVLPPVVGHRPAERAAEAAGAMARDLDLTIPGADGEDPVVIDAADDRRRHLLRAARGRRLRRARRRRRRHGRPRGAREGRGSGAGERADHRRRGRRLGGVIPARTDRKLDVAASSEDLVDALARRAAGTAVAALPLVVEVTAAGGHHREAEAVLPQMQMISSWTTYYVPGRGQRLRREHQHPRLRHRRAQPRSGRVDELLGQHPAAVGRARLHVRRRDHQRPEHAGRRPRGRHLLDLDHAVQRGAARRPGDGRPAQPLLLHRPLPGRPRRHGLDHGRLGTCRT